MAAMLGVNQLWLMSMLVTEAAAAEDGVRLGNTNKHMRALARKQPAC